MNFQKFESHVAGHGEPMWNQSYYFNAYDPKTRTGCLIRIGLLENMGHANSWLIVFQDGLPLFTRTNLQLPYTTERPAGGMHIAGMHIEVLEPLRKLRIRFDEADFAMDLVWTSTHEMADCIAMSKGDSGTFAEEMAHVHLEGPCIVSGHLVVRGAQSAFQGIGIRDVAAGVRNWDSLQHYRLAWPVFENGMVFCGVRGDNTSGKSAYMRMFHDGQQWLRVAEIVDDNDYEDYCPFTVREMRWRFTDEKGRAYAFSAKPLFRWLFAQDTFVVCEQMMEFRLSDGTLGYGLCEGGFRLPWQNLAVSE
ncbi:DUF7064 domain-containing protein [Rhodoferax ferrireducens]|uniref:DUF7064 domain-containing protein n=1 Tax=Rhodoferax ferrireducens TaxID=192843 RepID=UPI000E0CD170|nr:hypothetical protein [Rhodoferax ferrireducens]